MKFKVFKYLSINKCFESGRIPQVWKSATVTALHKKGSVGEVKNYRPISLTCILSKIYERFVRDHILERVAPLISNHQHGFLSGRSCLSNLLEFMDSVNEMLINGDCVDVFYLDFQKAFDTVPHYRLLVKLRNYGIDEQTLKVIADFLSGRSFRVRVGDSLSSFHQVLSGVPQGSVLGPLLFLLYINDLPDELRGNIFMFADDVKMSAQSSNSEESQADIDRMCVWQDLWLLRFNSVDQKCKVMHIGNNNPGKDYYLSGTKLPVITTEKDLGVTVNNDLSWDKHIDASVKKANSLIAWVTRSVICRSKHVMLNIYKAMIRPHIEYCVQIWAPAPHHGNWMVIMKLENVQRAFTRLIDGIGLLPYDERLKGLNLTTLLERRARGDLIETFRIVKGIAQYGNKLFNISRNGYRLVLGSSTANTKIQDFFSRRVVRYWNKLPEHVISADTVNGFKNNLQRFKDKNLDKPGNFWELSQEVYNRIDNSDRNSYVDFMLNNSHIAKAKGINIK